MPYALSYFRTTAEALHLALSDDGLIWTPLNQNRPVLTGTAGTRSLRDPFIFRAQDGRYHLLCTDGWRSTSIVHCASEDLIHWSEQVAIPVMADVPGARNAWAPECFYDREADLYRLIWSSTVLDDEPPGPPGTTVPGALRPRWDHRIWSSATHDFTSYGRAVVFFDPGYSVIDATVAYDEARRSYLMVFKDERGENRVGSARTETDYKALRVCRASLGSGPFGEVSELISPAPVEGPTLFRRDNRWYLLYDHFLEHHYGLSVSDDGDHWRVLTEHLDLGFGARHASVFEVEATTAEQLRRAWP